MSYKNIIRFSLTNALAFVLSTSVFGIGENVQAQFITGGGAYANMGGSAGMWGSGYWGGMQGCQYPTKQGTNTTSVSDEERAANKKISALQLQLKKLESDKAKSEREMEFAQRKLERQFDSEILDFLLSTHIEKDNQCGNYKTPSCNATSSTGQSAAQIVDQNGEPIPADISNAITSTNCGNKDDVPERLQNKWVTSNGGGYCTAKSKSSAGAVSPSICGDQALWPEERKSSAYSTSECGKILADYRKNKIKKDQIQDKIERLEREIEDREYAISDAQERAQLEREYRLANQTEGDCPECAAEGRGYTYSSQKRDWGYILGNLGIGLALGMVGKKYDQAVMEQNAQLGYPSQQGYPTAVSMGAPYVLAGVYGAVNGGTGSGGFGCGAGIGGTGNPYGSMGGMNGPFGGPMGAYGPYANMGGAFGYPQNMYGSPWGGGMYLPGYGPGGMFAGPNGGWPGGFNTGYAFNAMTNGGYMSNMGYMNNIGYMSNMGYMNNMGYMANMGFMANMGYMSNMGNMTSMCITYPCNTGFQMNMGIPMNTGMPMNTGYMANIGAAINNPQYQMQLLQMQQQMVQQQMQQYQMQQQMQQQYYQAQVQAQQQQYQRQMQAQQQASQIQQEIASLQMRLQMVYSGAYYGADLSGGYYNGGTTGVGGSLGSQAPTFIPTSIGTAVTSPYPTYPTYPTNPGTGTQVTVPTSTGR